MDDIRNDIEQTLGWFASELKCLDEAMLVRVRCLIGSFFRAKPEAKSLWWGQEYDRDPEWGGIFVVNGITFLDRVDLVCDDGSDMGDEKLCELLCDARDALENSEIDELIREFLGSPAVSDVLYRTFGVATIRALPGAPAGDEERALATLGIAPRPMPC